MKLAYIITATTALTGARAAPASSQDEGLPAGVMHFPLTRKAPDHSKAANLFRRADDFSIELSNLVTLFTTELEIGSNHEKVSVQVDTGSSDLWVMDASNPYCRTIVNGSTQITVPDTDNVNEQWRVNCQASAMFNATDSSTFARNSTPFSITYGDGSFANGSYVHDDIILGGSTIHQANFALANRANSTTAVWGIGLDGTEATVRVVNQDGVYSPTYLNLPMQMKAQGLIQSNAYSLWLNDLNAENGSLLFGGVDHTKYSGSLQTVPFVSSDPRVSNPSRFLVMLHGLSIYQGNNSAQIIQCSLPFLLDSGTSFIMFPDQFIEPLIASIGAVYSEKGYILVPCDLEGGLVFDMSGIQIEVPFNELTVDASGVTDTCALGILDGGDSFILGDTFLRSVYAVYDLDSKQIGLAKPVYNVSSSSIDVISSGIPSATQAPSYSSTEIQNSIITSHATFFFNPRASGASIPSGGYGTFTTTLFSQTTTFTGVSSSDSLFHTNTVATFTSERRRNAAQMNGQSSLGSALTGLLGLLLYI